MDSKTRDYSENRTKVWEVLCKSFFCKYISVDSSIVDIGAGNCNFINAIQATRKAAVDKDSNIMLHANNDINICIARVPPLSMFKDNSFDIVFSSNMIEHLENKAEVMIFIKELCRICKPTGKCILMFPNVKYTKEFWDCFEHKVPLTNKTITELENVIPIKVTETIPRFLPYQMGDSTSKTIKLPFIEHLVWLYLKLPMLWRVFGKQCVIVFEKVQNETV